MLTVEQVERVLKSLYLGIMSDQLNTIHPFLSCVEQTTSDVWGKEIRKVLYLTSEADYLQYVLTLQNLYGSITIPDRVFQASENNAGAIIHSLESKCGDLLQLARWNIDRQLFGDGSGIIGRVVSVEGNRVQVTDIKNFIKGLHIDIFSSLDNTSLITSREILEVDMSNNTIVLNGMAIPSGLINANDFITLIGAYNKELCGLRAIFNDSETLYGLKRAECQYLQPLKIEAQVINDNVIQAAIDQIDGRAGRWPDFIICSNDVKRAYQEYLITNRANIDVMNLQGGYKAISYNGIPVVSSRFCPNGTMYLLNTKDFKFHQLCDWRWLEYEDGSLLMQCSTDNSYRATLVKYANLICDRPWAQAVITGIKDPYNKL